MVARRHSVTATSPYPKNDNSNHRCCLPDTEHYSQNRLHCNGYRIESCLHSGKKTEFCFMWFVWARSEPHSRGREFNEISVEGNKGRDWERCAEEEEDIVISNIVMFCLQDLNCGVLSEDSRDL